MPIGSLSTQDAQLPVESLRALDWLNFFLAALLVGFGPFVASSLSDRGWSPANIGLVLTVSGLAGLLTQVPAGELIDVAKSKRTLVSRFRSSHDSAALSVHLLYSYASPCGRAMLVTQDPQRTLRGLHSTTSSTVELAECRIHKETRDAAGRAGARSHGAFREVGDSIAAEIEVWLLGW
jgi:hypothetical protein